MIEIVRGDKVTYLRVPNESWKNFQALVHRGINLWPDASPELKVLADLVTEGKVQQDYSREKKLSPVRADESLTSFVKCEDKTSYWYNLCNNCGLHLVDHRAGSLCSRWVPFEERNPHYIPPVATPESQFGYAAGTVNIASGNQGDIKESK